MIKLIVFHIIPSNIRMLFCSLLFLYTGLLSATPEQVSIQLKWLHSFQFAGYYAAIEKGFYRDAGLDVTLKQIDFSKQFVEQVIAGESEYGVSDSALLAYHLKGEPVVLLNQIFQHSALVFLSHRDSGIISPYEMPGKKVAFNVTNLGDVSLNALLLNTLGDVSKIQEVPFATPYYKDFIEGKTDVVSAYSTSQPYLFELQGIKVNIINPQNYGIDYYGDNFFTTQNELDLHPRRVEKMSAATKKGWKYALDNPDEIIRLIRKKYAPMLSEKYLQYEARTTLQMIVPELIELGSFDPRRYQQAAEDYRRLGFAESSQIKSQFFYKQPSQPSALLALSATEKSWINKNPVISVGGLSDWAPFDFVDDKGKHAGIANDYLKLISDKTGLKFKVAVGQWSEILQNIRDKKIDLLGDAYYAKEREKFLNYSTPYFEMLDYFFIRDDLAAETLEDLNGKRVAMPKSYLLADTLRKHFPNIRLIIVDSLDDAIDAVLENRAEILYDNYAVLSHVLAKQGINSIIPFKSTRKIGGNALHIVSRKDAPELASIIQKGLDAISVDEKRIIYNKWLGSKAKTNEPVLNLNGEEVKWLKNHPVMNVGVESDWPPYEFIDRAGQLQGLSAGVLNLVEQRLGVKFRLISQYSWAETLEKAKEHKIDILSSTSLTPKRKQFLSFTDPFFTPLISIYTRKDSPALSSLDDLKNKTVAIENQFFLHEVLAEKHPEIKLLPVETTLDAIKMLSFGKADAYVGNEGAANWTIEKNALTNLKITPVTELGGSPLRLAVRKDWPMLQGILNKALATISDLEMSSLRRRWMGVESRAADTLILTRDEQQWLNNHKIIRFAGDPNWLPYEAFDNQGNYIGIVAEHLKLIEQKLGIKVEIVPTETWTESVAKVKQGEIDVLSETSDSGLKSRLIFTQPYLESPVVIVMKKNEDYVENIDQIKKRKIAVIEAYGYVPEIIEKYPEIDFEIVGSIQEGLTAVSTGKIDALLATLAQASYHKAELGINNIRIVGKTEFNTKLAFGMQKEFAPLVPLFNRALASISQNDKQGIFRKWGKHKYDSRIDYGLLVKLATVFFIILAIIIYWNRRLAKEIEFRKEVEAQTQALIDSIPLQIIVTASDGEIVTANPKALADYKIHSSDINQFNISDFYYDRNDREGVIKELAEKGKVEQKIIRIKYLNGAVRSMMISVMPIIYHHKKALLTISVDMTERVDMETALQQAKDSAESATRAKTEFLSNMSHEIRTPMNAIIGFTELLNEQIEDSKLKSFVKIIQSAGNNLLVLINDVLDLSKIEAGKLEIEKTACNPHELFTELGNIFMLKMREKNIDFILDIDPAIPKSLQLDSTRLRQVLLNLIGNAVKFTEQGAVRVVARTSNEDAIRSKLDLLVDVEDSGIGIAEDQQALIFKDFQQSSGQDDKKYGGTGLGLSISKRLVKMMGGELLLNSRLGQGSTFTVKLIDVDVATCEAEALESPSKSLSVSFLPAHLLAVDDVDDNRDLLTALFANTELKVSEAENGLEAVKLAKEQTFDLILMDIRMPVMDGYRAAQEIKSFSDVPIIALTASVMTDDFERIKSDNFNGYLTKPVLKKELFSELCKFLPFEENIVLESAEQKQSLSESELESLPFALFELKKLLEQCQTISKTNNISEIKLFVSDIMEISTQHPIRAISQYSRRLEEQVGSFDIAGIKCSLNEYPQLIQQLDQFGFSDGGKRAG